MERVRMAVTANKVAFIKPPDRWVALIPVRYGNWGKRFESGGGRGAVYLLLVPQGFYGINTSGLPGREKSGSQADKGQNSGGKERGGCGENGLAQKLHRPVV